jgi:hypothetical protein
MAVSPKNLTVVDGERVATEHIATALTAASFAYGDGTTQTFEPGGGTTYVDRGQQSNGEWYVDDDGRFARSGRPLTVPATTCTGS